jgi:hypothetical protein
MGSGRLMDRRQRVVSCPVDRRRGLRVGERRVRSLANDPLDPVGKAAPVGDRVVGAVRPSEGRVEVGDDLCGAVGSDDATKPSPVRKMRLRVPGPVLQASTQRGGR